MPSTDRPEVSFILPSKRAEKKINSTPARFKLSATWLTDIENEYTASPISALDIVNKVIEPKLSVDALKELWDSYKINAYPSLN